MVSPKSTNIYIYYNKTIQNQAGERNPSKQASCQSWHVWKWLYQGCHYSLENIWANICLIRSSTPTQRRALCRASKACGSNPCLTCWFIGEWSQASWTIIKYEEKRTWCLLEDRTKGSPLLTLFFSSLFLKGMSLFVGFQWLYAALVR